MKNIDDPNRCGLFIFIIDYTTLIILNLKMISIRSLVAC